MIGEIQAGGSGAKWKTLADQTWSLKFQLLPPQSPSHKSKQSDKIDWTGEGLFQSNFIAKGNKNNDLECFVDGNTGQRNTDVDTFLNR